MYNLGVITPTPYAIVPPSTNMISHVDAPPKIRRQRAILIRPGQDIPIVRLYRTHPGGPCRALTVRKSVRYLPSHRLALRYTSHHLDRFTSGSSSDHSSSDHLSADHSLAYHTLGHPTSDRSLSSSPSDSPATTLDRKSHSPSHSAGPSRKRYRSPDTTVPSSIPALRVLVPTLVNLLPPRKRFRDSILPKDSVEEDIDADVLEDIKADAMVVEVATGMYIETRVDAGIGMEVDDRVDIEDEVEGEAESSDKGTMEVGVDVVSEIDIPDEGRGHLDRIERVRARSLIASGKRAGLLDHISALERSNARIRGALRMASALSTYEANHAAELVKESQSQNRDDGENGNGGGNGNRNGRGNGNGNKGGNGNGILIGMLKVICLSPRYQVKYATCTLLNSALTWWNAHKRTIGVDAAFAMSWRELIKLMAEVFQELTILCTKMVPEEEDHVEKFIRGIPDNIQGNVIVAKPTRLQDAIHIANNLMDQKLKGYAVRNTENKRMLDNNQRDNHREKPPVKRSDCPKLNNQNRRNKTRNKINEARGKTCVLGGGEANPDPNVVTGMFLLNNHYASMLFDSGVDRSFVLTTFSALLDVVPSTLDVSYVVELVGGRILETNTVLRGCTLGLLGHLFNINLMPIELGSFDIIIGMDWLANHHEVIVCDEKIVRCRFQLNGSFISLDKSKQLD
ncbi:reverse transcriptase domain-containing protein [Tanacetum coccineum]